jgi:nicotinate-nucleotide adenylyltransferase
MLAFKKRVAVFGGTFDPPHSGHLKIAEQLISDGYTDNILFMPALHPPHKLNVNYSSFQDRFNMLHKALKSLPDSDKYKVSMLEKDFADRPSYTYNTLEYLTNKDSSIDYIIIIGADNLLTLHQWYKAKELIERWNILTYPRRGYENIQSLYNFWDKKTADKLSKTLLPFKLFNISSTEIRESINKEKNKPDFLTNPVYRYIIENKLYKK